jgi:hypothetical protein
MRASDADAADGAEAAGADVEDAGMNVPLSEYSTDGVKCPFCGCVFTPDEAYYYNENGYLFECAECTATFKVQPFCSWSWTSRAITWERG